ncbi:MAG: hypothetical protein NUW37_06600 [Planctomycetes bacterium]|nr:hypothetical protein [Planctomycetota bacterium]
MLTRTNQPEQAIALPEPRVRINIRLAASSDLKFIDDLQNMHTRMVGWMPTRATFTLSYFHFIGFVVDF